LRVAIELFVFLFVRCHFKTLPATLRPATTDREKVIGSDDLRVGFRRL
jgi:hypothetical protein